MKLEISRRQKVFIDSYTDETLYGGAAGGGKSYGQIIDALLYALRYPKSKQLILRRTFPELEKSLIRVALELYPREIFRYNGSTHTGTFANGSLVDFGYCDSENDVYRYQSAEYDTIRFDELTHFTESMYTYLISRCRGANDYPKMIKSGTNPGGIGHTWVKARFIDRAPPNTLFEGEGGTRVFIPARLQDNKFLMEKDPDYKRRLENLDDAHKRALLYGDWDVFEGQYFGEFTRKVHVHEPFEIPEHWRIYRTLDYGLDMLACYWIAVDEQGRGYVYRELYEPNLIISNAAKRIEEMTGDEKVYITLAPPDLWHRRQETGKSVSDIFAEHGIRLTQTSNSRIDGWMATKEWLKPFKDEQDVVRARLQIFPNCLNLIRTIPALQYDKRNPNDVAGEPHELTHAPDAIRGFCIYWTMPAASKAGIGKKWTPDMWEDYRNGRREDKARMIELWGEPE